MIKGLVAGFGARIDGCGVTLANLYGLGVRIVRQQVREPNGHDQLDAALAELADCPEMDVVWIADRLEDLVRVPAGAKVEWLNEPNLRMSAEAYAVSLRPAVVEASALGLMLAGGGISNLATAPLDWLRAVIERVPELAVVAFHRYPHGSGCRTPHPGFESRDAEVQALNAIAGGRPLWLTEFGYHTGLRKTSWWPCAKPKRWTDADVARMVAWEWDFWNDKVEMAVLYQLNDAENRNDPESSYGIRDTIGGGAWKPVARTFSGG